jgi:SnoaL-like domain
MAHENSELVRRWFAAGIAVSATRDAEPLRDLIDPEFEFAPHITGGHEGVEFRGFEGLLTFISVQAETWENLRAEPSEMRENGDVVVVLGTIRARGRASGVDVEEPAVWLLPHSRRADPASRGSRCARSGSGRLGASGGGPATRRLRRARRTRRGRQSQRLTPSASVTGAALCRCAEKQQPRDRCRIPAKAEVRCYSATPKDRRASALV